MELIHPRTIEHEPLKDGDIVQVFNIAGRKTIEGKLQNGQSIPVSHLPKGMYIVRIGNQTGKFVKE
jgi:anaerobic selenocysteine-containing dehydrogenase